MFEKQEIAKKMTPLITIITVTFNAEKFIEETIQSVIKQRDLFRIDFIVIDGGSNDKTLNILKEYNSEITFWISEPDKGIYDAFNKGWNAAKEDSYILYLGAGDKILGLPKVDSIKNSQVIYGRVILGDNLVVKSKSDFRLKLGNTIHHQVLLVKKSLHPYSPFDLHFKTYADFDFNQRLFKKKVKFTFDESFVSYALPGGVSQKFNTEESISVVRKNFGRSYVILARLYYLFQNFKKRH